MGTFSFNDSPPEAEKGSILVVDDMPDNLRLLVDILTEDGYEVRAAQDGETGLESALEMPPDLILLDIKMPGMNGYEMCERLKSTAITRDIPVLFISALYEPVDKVKGFDVGGVDFMTKPVQPVEVLARVRTHLILQRLRNHLEDLVEKRTTKLHQEMAQHKKTAQHLQDALSNVKHLQEQLQAENIYLREGTQQAHNFDDIIGQGELLRYLLFKVEQVASTNTTVLIAGETGTGKELIAKAIHQTGPRREYPLVKLNCAALPAHLIESELFGHEKGAFTGAQTKRIGRFEVAHGGTIFLDEIGELPPELQPKLLRVLQDGEFERIGSSQTMTVDVRVIAATNRDLEAEVQAGRFRQDLFYRLNVFPLSVPPLRERPDDIPLLVHNFVKKCNKKLGKQIDQIPPFTMKQLKDYSWPGNIRELENVIERAVILAQDNVLRVKLPENSSVKTPIDKSLEEVERDHILNVLTAKDWRIEGPKGAALVLGLHPNTLRFRMKKLGIRRPNA